MQNHTLRYTLVPHRSNKEGLHPIYLCFTVDRKPRLKSTGYYVHPTRQWNKKTETVINHPLEEQINRDLLIRKRDFLDVLVDKKASKRKIMPDDIDVELNRDVFAFTENFLKHESRHLSDRRKVTFETVLNKLEMFLGHRTLPFNDVDYRFLLRFQNWLLDKGIRSHKKDKKANTTILIMSAMGSLFNKNKQHITDNPFADPRYNPPKGSKAEKEFLSQEEIDLWMEKLPTFSGDDYNCAVWFMFGCHTGLRVSDWQVFDFNKRVHKDYIAVTPIKTGGWAVIPLFSRLREIIYLAKQCQRKKNMAIDVYERMPRICRQLGINKHITSHCGRKTFAVTRCLARGVSSETAATLMGIDVQTFVESYMVITPEKVKAETSRAWAGE